GVPAPDPRARLAAARRHAQRGGAARGPRPARAARRPPARRSVRRAGGVAPHRGRAHAMRRGRGHPADRAPLTARLRRQRGPGAAAPRGASGGVVRSRRAGGQRRKFHDRGNPVIKQTVRAASEADGLVNDMRQLAQAVVPGQTVDDPAYMERTISTRIATFLMVLLVTIIFATSALPDVGPTLAKVIQAHL